MASNHYGHMNNDGLNRNQAQAQDQNPFRQGSLHSPYSSQNFQSSSQQVWGDKKQMANNPFAAFAVDNKQANQGRYPLKPMTKPQGDMHMGMNIQNRTPATQTQSPNQGIDMSNLEQIGTFMGLPEYKLKVDDIPETTVASMPGMPTTPSMPGMPMPITPSMPGMPTTPSMPSIPGMPTTPSMPGMPTTPMTPSMPASTTMGEPTKNEIKAEEPKVTKEYTIEDCIQSESNGFKFYEQLAGKAENDGIKKALLEICEECTEIQSNLMGIYEIRNDKKYDIVDKNIIKDISLISGVRLALKEERGMLKKYKKDLVNEKNAILKEKLSNAFYNKLCTLTTLQIIHQQLL